MTRRLTVVCELVLSGVPMALTGRSALQPLSTMVGRCPRTLIVCGVPTVTTLLENAHDRLPLLARHWDSLTSTRELCPRILLVIYTVRREKQLFLRFEARKATALDCLECRDWLDRPTPQLSPWVVLYMCRAALGPMQLPFCRVVEVAAVAILVSLLILPKAITAITLVHYEFH